MVKKNGTRSKRNVVAPLGDDSQDQLELREADIKLIQLIRSIGCGEIDSIQIKDGLPVSYKAAWKTKKFT